MDHRAVFSSAQAIRSPPGAKYMPLARPAGWRNVDSWPSVLHFRMRSLGWSVNSTFPSGSHVGPSVNAKPPASFSTVASGATTRSPVLHGIAGLTDASATAGRSSETQCYPRHHTRADAGRLTQLNSEHGGFSRGPRDFIGVWCGCVSW